MDPQELVELASRILSTWSMGRSVDEKDVATLRKHASPEWPPDVAFDQLACLIVGREAERVMAESRAERQRMKIKLAAPNTDKIA